MTINPKRSKLYQPVSPSYAMYRAIQNCIVNALRFLRLFKLSLRYLQTLMRSSVFLLSLSAFKIFVLVLLV